MPYCCATLISLTSAPSWRKAARAAAKLSATAGASGIVISSRGIPIRIPVNEVGGWRSNVGYLGDYERILGDGLKDLYRVEDTWQNFDRMAKVMDLRFDQWQRRHGPFSY